MSLRDIRTRRREKNAKATNGCRHLIICAWECTLHISNPSTFLKQMPDRLLCRGLIHAGFAQKLEGVHAHFADKHIPWERSTFLAEPKRNALVDYMVVPDTVDRSAFQREALKILDDVSWPPFAYTPAGTTRLVFYEGTFPGMFKMCPEYNIMPTPPHTYADLYTDAFRGIIT